MVNIEEWVSGNLGLQIWKGKYQHNNETFEEWLDRVSNGNEKIKERMKSKDFLPAGRILANRGLHKEGRKVCYSNCFVTSPPEDNLESIFETTKKMARTYSYGGGIGVDISKLRPKGSKVHNAAEESTGAVSFMDLYSKTTEVIGQNGRRGALMISLDVSHPDLEEFINIKNDLDKVTKANISIKVDDKFMQAVKEGKEYELHFQTDTGETISKIVNAKDIFRKLAKNNWNMAEPGILYWDNINNYNIMSEDEDFEFDGTNPCAEEPLPAGGSCLLGSINLSNFVKEPFTKNAMFDFFGFSDAVRDGVEFLNEVLDENIDLLPLEEQKESAENLRQIGLGVMGIADMLIKMGVGYGSEQSLKICNEISSWMINSALIKSSLLAKEYGSFPAMKKDKILESSFINSVATDETIDYIEKYGLRNSQLLTIAPTGSISNLLGVSGGIEPIFALSYQRRTETLHDEETFYTVYTPIVKEYMENKGIETEDDLPDFFITSHDLKWKERVDTQSAWQRYIDASISSTVNLPNSATVEDVEKLYIYAWEKGLKGITVFRDGCARAGILTLGNNDEETETDNDIKPKDRPTITQGTTTREDTGCGKIYLTLNVDENDNPIETFISSGSDGGCSLMYQGLSRMISLVLRSGVEVKEVIEQLKSVDSCPSCLYKLGKGDKVDGKSCPDIIGKALESIIGEKVLLVEDNKLLQCPECGEKGLVLQEGCQSCKNCGFSRCD